MRQNSGGIESLLLLSCLVGAVSFYCISIAVGQSLFNMPEAKIRDLLQELNKMQTEIQMTEGKIDSLLAVKSYLDEELSKSEIMSNRPKNTGTERLKLQQRLTSLEAQILKLTNERNELSRQIELLLANIPQDSKDDEEKLLAQLRARQVKLNSKIKPLEQELNKLTLEGQNSNLQALSIEYDLLREKAQDKQVEIDKLKLALLTSGTENYKNPIYFDCRKRIARVYPGKSNLTQSEITLSRVRNLIKGHDIIVLYVRSDGFDVFNELFPIIDNLDLPFCYEPLVANQNIELLIGNK